MESFAGIDLPGVDDLLDESVISFRVNTMAKDPGFNRLSNYITAIFKRTIQLEATVAKTYYPEHNEYLHFAFVSYDPEDFIEWVKEVAEGKEYKAILVETICFFHPGYLVVNINSSMNFSLAFKDTIEAYKIYGTHQEKGGGVYDIAETDTDMTDEERKILVNLKSVFTKSVNEAEATYARSQQQLTSIKDYIIKMEEENTAIKMGLRRKQKLLKSNSKGLILEVLSSFRSAEDQGLLKDVKFKENGISVIISDIILRIDYANDPSAAMRAQKLPDSIWSEIKKAVGEKPACYYVGDIEVYIGYSSESPVATIHRQGQDFMPSQRKYRNGVQCHPHIGNTGSLCLGIKGGNRLKDLLGNMKLVEAFNMVGLCLRSYVSSNPYGSIAEKFYKPYADVAECKRIGKEKTTLHYENKGKNNGDGDTISERDEDIL